MTIPKFVNFLKSMGVEAKNSFLSGFLPSDFLLSDDPSIEYTMKVSGDKRLVGCERDETKLTLS